MTKKIFIITLLTLIFNNSMATKNTNGQTDSKKIVSVTLEYYDVAKVRELQRTLSYPKYVEEIEKQAHKVFDVDSTHWGLILNVIATAKPIEKNPDGKMLKPIPNDFTLIINYDDETDIKIRIWKGGIIIQNYRVDAKYFDSFYQMLNSHISIMAQEKQPEILFEQQNINVLLEQDKDTKTFLTSVTIYMPVNYTGFWGSDMTKKEFQERKIEFTMVYYYTNESKYGLSSMEAVAYFSKNAANYKIYEAKFLQDWYRRESENHPLQPMSFEAAKGECVFIGNSDNDKLLAVKVWKYVMKHWEK